MLPRESIGRLAVAFALLACLFWGGWTVYRNDVASLRDRREIRAQVQSNVERIERLTEIATERDKAARANIALSQHMAARIEDVAREQKAIRELIQAQAKDQAKGGTP